MDGDAGSFDDFGAMDGGLEDFGGEADFDAFSTESGEIFPETSPDDLVFEDVGTMDSIPESDEQIWDTDIEIEPDPTIITLDDGIPIYDDDEFGRYGPPESITPETDTIPGDQGLSDIDDIPEDAVDFVEDELPESDIDSIIVADDQFAPQGVDWDEQNPEPGTKELSTEELISEDDELVEIIVSEEEDLSDQELTILPDDSEELFEDYDEEVVITPENEAGELTPDELVEEELDTETPEERNPINYKYANEEYPLEEKNPELYEKFPKGVRFDEEGFPDFSPHALYSVEIDMEGNRTTDYTKANEAAGIEEIPDDYTWHHHQDCKTMQLVPTDLHNEVRHTGGVSIIKHQNE